MSDSGKLKEKLTSKERFYSSLTDKKISDKDYDQILNIWKEFEMETIKIITSFT